MYLVGERPIRFRHFTTVYLLFLSTAVLQATPTSLFDGKTLSGWEGDLSYWRVEDGAITGQSTADHPCKRSTYLAYTGKEFGNFELTLSFRLTAQKGNSGIQYRSQWANRELHKLKGYQADLETGPNYSGILYEQDGRGIMAKRGQQVSITPNGKKSVTPLPAGAKAQASIKPGEWNTYRIIADGNTLTHQINGHTTIRVEDGDKKHRADSGLLAFQLHQGPPMKVQYKDISIKELPKAKPVLKDLKLKTLPDFRVEQIYQVDKATQGSWVTMCFDPQGLLYVCDQYGKLFRITLEDGQVSAVQPLESPGHAQGLCWAFGSLYMATYGKPGAVHRLTDTTNDGHFDQTEKVLTVHGGGEHGHHSLIKTADGKGLYLIQGNHVPMSGEYTSISGKNWAEDTLHPHLPDASGHAASIRAPGGTLLRFSPDGMEREIIANGMRNTYDIALSPSGDIFGYDSDMEYDIGTPWYRPTRVLHLIQGGEYGWRTGTSKWPDYYADSLGSVLDVGPGSPTGVLFGSDAGFPVKYRKAFYALDWTFGRIYAVHLHADGASYRAEKEVFVSGKPLPVTDAAIGPDGVMYFLTGGRRLQSGLFKVAYTGNDRNDDPLPATLSEAQIQLRTLQKSRDLNQLWPALANDDRVLRYAARVSLETLPPAQWHQRFAETSNPQSIITASLAIARTKGDRQLAIEKLLSIPFDSLNRAQKLEYLRAVSLVFIRLGEPDPATRNRFIEQLDAKYPATGPLLNRELCRLLVYLDAPQVLSRTLTLMQTTVAEQEEVPEELLAGSDRYGKTIRNMLKNPPDPQGLHYALMLTNARTGWTLETVTTYFDWLKNAKSKSGGNSYQGLLKNIRAAALKNIPVAFAALAEQGLDTGPAAAPLPVAKGPGRHWTTESALAEVADLSQADEVNGLEMFKATLCSQCHAHSGQGGASGPDLTNLSNRFNKEDILNAIVHPSEVISDQYGFTILHLKRGGQIHGRVINEDDTHVFIASNPFDFSVKTPVKKATIVKRSASPNSPMPPSLINALNPDELRDLMLFLSGK